MSIPRFSEALAAAVADERWIDAAESALALEITEGNGPIPELDDDEACREIIRRRVPSMPAEELDRILVPR